ncbi:Fur family transcriptional regulator [Roseicyclus sp. F158]|uniref:Fur family transcriptional regulator n=1 Tax=Tropicimonas omnivorans TaxID=3075590 RepID=A0ABU3DKX6_9RHOB|nr:Fur family transcriptional regulator [Roseicyclus sp. F158]MDT0684365.1 Fur family transcriptional regulator [Roseicyclus sp. F158]
MSGHAFEQHDHHSCIADGVTAAVAYCAEHKLQFTKTRKRVLEILLERHRAMGAYEILDRLREEGLGSQPPVAYRALDFLVTNGFAHRIERLNAFIACTHLESGHAPAFLICRSCDRVVEAETDLGAGELARAAAATGFVIERTVREAEGLCPDCSPGEVA